MRKAPKDGKTRLENQQTQPLTTHRVFTNHEVVTEGWYPALPVKKLKKGQVTSVKITYHRIVLYRSTSGKVHALDAFCPHMGADLGNGVVVGENIQCYFHQWQFSPDGNLAKTLCSKKTMNPKLQAWPCEEKYGFIWVYAAPEAPYPVPHPSGLEGERLVSWHLKTASLFAHHHVMMVGGVDLLHFATVHHIDVNFNLDIDHIDTQQAVWKLDGGVPNKGWRGRLANWFINGRVNYHAKIAGASIITLTYGPDLFFRFFKKKVPPFYILWGCRAHETGLSDVEIFLVTKKSTSLLGWFTSQLRLAITVLLLIILRDDDVKAFPYMRFNIGKLTKEDHSVTKMVQFINKMPISKWSLKPKE